MDSVFPYTARDLFNRLTAGRDEDVVVVDVGKNECAASASARLRTV